MLEALSPRQAAVPSLHRRQLRSIAFVGSFPPRRCGIATFTADLAAAVTHARPGLNCSVVAVNDQTGGYAYEDRVSDEICQDDAASYSAAAAHLNEMRVDAVSLQHEFGIFGGPAGSHVLTFLEQLKRPVFTTLHTVLERPNADQRRVMKQLIERSRGVIVMTRKGRDILVRVFPEAESKIGIIAHGAPDRPFGENGVAKKRLGLAGRDVVLTFGLLSPNKGIESVIRALPSIAEARPNLTYVVLGATHPHLVARDGESYRATLQRLAAELGASDHVRFVDAFVTTDVLIDYLAAADVYVLPYLNEAQITSGTLAYALALGKPVVSTRFWHAEEALRGDRGVLVDFGASDQFASAITRLLVDEPARAALGKRAYMAARDTIWPRIGERYVELMEKAIVEPAQSSSKRRQRSLPGVSLRALERMSDACGMLQHARFGIPDRNHGYCLDDNARALVTAQRVALLEPANRTMERLAPVYASFVEHAWNEDRGGFRNFMSYDRTWLEQIGSCDCYGRAVWAIGETALFAPDKDMRAWALHLGERVAASPQKTGSLRSMAFSAVGFEHLDRAGLPGAREELEALAAGLFGTLAAARTADWVWFEDALGYDNARLPEALLRAGSALKRPEYVEAGLEALAWLTGLHTQADGSFSPVGTGSFGQRRQRPVAFDQQPLEAAAAVDANWAAFDVTGDVRWAGEAQRAFAWFLGVNALGSDMALPETGGCRDGLGPDGVNRNQGAESILSYLMALCAMRVRERTRQNALG